jgi:hypothetical protein
MKNRGRIVEFGYPQGISLHTNILLDFNKDGDLAGKV